MTRDRYDASRREILLGLGTIGVASVGAGLGTYAAFTDTEQAPAIVTAGALDLTVQHESNYNGRSSDIVNSGALDGKPGVIFDLPDVKPGDSGRSRFCFELETNPAYLWLCGELTGNAEMGRTEPEIVVDSTGGNPGEGNGELADAIDVELAYADMSGNVSETITSGTLREVLDTLATGVPLDAGAHEGVLDAGSQQAFEPSSEETPRVEPCLVFEWEIDRSVGNEIQTDQVEFALTFHAEQARHTDGTNNPCDSGGGNDHSDDGDGDDHDGDGHNESKLKGISFSAFCVDDGSIEPSDITLLQVTERKSEGDPIEIHWESNRPIDTVVLKAGNRMENFDAAGQRAGSARVGQGTPTSDEQSPSNPCPDESAGGVKFEYQGGRFIAEK